MTHDPHESQPAVSDWEHATDAEVDAVLDKTKTMLMDLDAERSDGYWAILGPQLKAERRG